MSAEYRPKIWDWAMHYRRIGLPRSLQQLEDANALCSLRIGLWPTWLAKVISYRPTRVVRHNYGIQTTQHIIIIMKSLNCHHHPGTTVYSCRSNVRPTRATTRAVVPIKITIYTMNVADISNKLQ